jgi:hypothetical protein
VGLGNVLIVSDFYSSRVFFSFLFFRCICVLINNLPPTFLQCSAAAGNPILANLRNVVDAAKPNTAVKNVNLRLGRKVTGSGARLKILRRTLWGTLRTSIMMEIMTIMTEMITTETITMDEEAAVVVLGETLVVAEVEGDMTVEQVAVGITVGEGNIEIEMEMVLLG